MNEYKLSESYAIFNERMWNTSERHFCTGEENDVQMYISVRIIFQPLNIPAFEWSYRSLCLLELKLAKDWWIPTEIHICTDLSALVQMGLSDVFHIFSFKIP